MQTLHKSFLALVCLVFMTISGCAGESSPSAKLPEAALPANTMMAIHVDAAAISPDKLRASAMRILNAFPDDIKKDAIEDLDKSIAEYKTKYDSIIEAGAQGVVVAVEAPQEGEDPKGVFLISNSKGADLTKLTGAVNALKDGNDGTNVVELKALTDEWSYLAGDDEMLTPGNGSADVTKKITTMLNDTQGGAKLVFVMTDELKSQISENAGNIDPAMAGLMMQMQKLDHITAGITFGSSPVLNANMIFADETAAKDFLTAYNGLIVMGKSMAQGQLSRMPDAPDEATINALFDSMEMTQDGSKLSMSIDATTFDTIGQILGAMGGAPPMRGLPF